MPVSLLLSYHRPPATANYKPGKRANNTTIDFKPPENKTKQNTYLVPSEELTLTPMNETPLSLRCFHRLCSFK